MFFAQICLLLVTTAAFSAAQQSAAAAPPLAVGNGLADDGKTPEKPEARQIGAVLPMSWYQQAANQIAQSAAPPSAPPASWGSSLTQSLGSTLGSTFGSGSGQSLLSLLRPTQAGGRRSSLTSRLRNLMSALFFR